MFTEKDERRIRELFEQERDADARATPSFRSVLLWAEEAGRRLEAAGPSGRSGGGGHRSSDSLGSFPGRTARSSHYGGNRICLLSLLGVSDSALPECSRSGECSGGPGVHSLRRRHKESAMRATSSAVALVIFLCLGAQVSGQGKNSQDLDQMKVQRTTPHHLDPMKRTLVEPVMALYYAEEIGLTEEQRGAIERQLKEAKAKFGLLERKLEAENQLLFRLVENPASSEQKVVAQMDRVLAVERDIKVTNLLSSWRVRRLLSVAQRERLMSMSIPPPPTAAAATASCAGCASAPPASACAGCACTPPGSACAGCATSGIEEPYLKKEKTMRRATVLSTCAVMVVLLCSVIIWAQAPPPPPPPPPPGYAVGAGGTVPHSAKVVDLIVPVQKYLELTDAQVQQWKDVQATRKQQAEELGLKVRQLEDQLEGALSEANPSAAAVGQLVIQLRSARQERGEHLGVDPRGSETESSPRRRPRSSKWQRKRPICGKSSTS